MITAWILASALMGGDATTTTPTAHDAILAEVTRLRGLAAIAAVAPKVATTAAIRAHLEQELEAAYPGDALTRMGMALAHFGLIPKGFDLPGYYASFLESRVGGYYDWTAKTLFLAENLATGQAETLLAHELVHALQDQHYDLAQFFAEAAHDSEAYLARSALSEGDALAIEIEYGLRDRGIRVEALGDLSGLAAGRIEALRASAVGQKSAPLFLIESSYFPYAYGLGFVQAVRRAHPQAWMDRVYENPPRSSEQILHPERYLGSRDDPTTVTLPDLGPVLPAWQETWSDVAGELGARAVVAAYLPGDLAATAGEGWDGDRYVALTRDGRTGLVWSTLWDSPCDAQEFFSTYARVIPLRRTDALSKARRRPEIAAWSSDEGDYLIAREGTRVYTIEGFESEETLAILAALAPALAAVVQP